MNYSPFGQQDCRTTGSNGLCYAVLKFIFLKKDTKKVTGNPKRKV